MNETYDPVNHLLVIAYIVFYWHLLRIWHQPPPPDHDDKTAKKKAVAGLTPEIAGVALRQLAAPSATSSRETDIASPMLSGDSLAVIRAADERFDKTSFLTGAALAYELVVNAYAEEDTLVLERLLDPQTASAFVDAIASRNDRGERIALTFIGIKNMEIMHAWLEADVAEISVRFTSEAVTATYAADGAVVDGNPEEVVQLTDQWIFARCLSSTDPNWKLVATEGG